MEIREMHEHLRTLEHFADNFRNAKAKERASRKQDRLQGSKDYATTAMSAKAYFERNDDLYELLAADEDAHRADQFFLDINFAQSDLNRAIAKLEEFIAIPEPVPAEESPDNE